MIKFYFCSKLLISLAVASAILNLLQPGYNTFYGLNQIKNLHADTAVKTISQYLTDITRLSQPSPKTLPHPSKHKDCDKFAREYEAMLATISQLERTCKTSNNQ